MNYGFFAYVVLKFCMTNAISTFVTYMNKVVSKNKEKHAQIYQDNIIVYIHTNKHLNKDLPVLLNTLQDNQLLAKILKCMF